MIGVEQGSHRIKQILVLMQVTFLPNLTEFKLCANERILECLVVPDVVHQAGQSWVGVPLLVLGSSSTEIVLQSLVSLVKINNFNDLLLLLRMLLD